MLVRNFNVSKELSEYLKIDIDDDLYKSKAFNLHYSGLISEKEFWQSYMKEFSINFEYKEPLLGKFFNPKLDMKTVEIIKILKSKGYKVVAGSNIMTSHYDALVDLKFFDIFDKVYASHLIHLVKPDKAFYSHICKCEGVKREEAIFIDDLEENVKSARVTGLTGILFENAINLKKELDVLGL